MFVYSRHCEGLPEAIQLYFPGSHKGLPLPLTGRFPDCFAFQARNDANKRTYKIIWKIIFFHGFVPVLRNISYIYLETV
jgi:hypothetical protein